MDPATITLAISAAKAAMDIAEKAKKTFYDDKIINDAKKVSQEKLDTSIDSFKAEIKRNKEIIDKLIIQIEANKELIESHNETIINLSEALITTADTAKSARKLAVYSLVVAVTCGALAVLAIYS